MCRKRTKKGQAVAEFAILFPFFLLIVIGGVIDFGFAFYNLITLQQMANDTAQYATSFEAGPSGRTDAEILAYVNSRKPHWWSGNFSQISADPTDGAPGVFITTSDTTDGVAKVKYVGLSFTSPMYTPFYQTLFHTTTQLKGLQIRAAAAFQIPKNVQ